MLEGGLSGVHRGGTGTGTGTGTPFLVVAFRRLRKRKAYNARVKEFITSNRYSECGKDLLSTNPTEKAPWQLDLLGSCSAGITLRQRFDIRTNLSSNSGICKQLDASFPHQPPMLVVTPKQLRMM